MRDPAAPGLHAEEEQQGQDEDQVGGDPRHAAEDCGEQPAQLAEVQRLHDLPELGRADAEPGQGRRRRPGELLALACVLREGGRRPGDRDDDGERE
jgi:hypothetical protein